MSAATALPSEARVAASKPKLSGLEALRFFAALVVVITHTTFYAFERLGTHHDYWRRGAAGVDIFFVLSGYVMIYSSTRLMKDSRGWRIFAEKRIFRIVPMYWLATTIKLVILLAAPAVILHSKPRLIPIICSYLFLPAKDFQGRVEPLLSVGWTLTFEMFFYFLFTLALLFRVNVYRVLGVLLVACALLSHFRNPSWPAFSVYLNPIVLEFFFGMLIARWIISGHRLHPLVAVATLILGLLGLFSAWQDTSLGHVLTTGIPSALIVLAIASIELYISPLIPKLILFFAEASYVLYLFHPLIVPAVPVIFAHLHIFSTVLVVIVGVLVALATTSLLHLLIEKPITQWLRRFAFEKRTPHF